MQIQDSQIVEKSVFVAHTQASVTERLITADDIQEWIVNYVAKLLQVNPSEVDVTISFERYGLDSAIAVGLTGDLGDWLGYELDPTLLYDYPTIESLVQYLASNSN